MSFFTKVPIDISPKPISYASEIITLGSCFAENMGQKLDYFQFKNLTNPFGIIFNSISLEKIIRRAVDKDFYADKDVFFFDYKWHCFEVHSRLSDVEKAVFIKNLNDTLVVFRAKLVSATHVIITLGTSWVYQAGCNQEVVANCHKLPQKQFRKILLSAEENAKSLEKIVNLVTAVNPNCKIIFTISPVRHLKDGFFENQVSKSHLFVALHQLISKKDAPQNLSYFPAYELLMDELRDYRFYAEDLLHPNATAIDYIWKKFVETQIDPTVKPTMDAVEHIRKSLNHKPTHSESPSHQKFVTTLQNRIDSIQKTHPFMQF